MSRVVYNALRIQQTSAADLNDIFNAFAAQTANADGQNFGEESLDGSAIGSGAQAAEAFAPVLHTTVATQPLTASYQQLNPGGVNPMRSSAFTLAANEVVYVTASVEFINDGGANKVLAGTELAMVLASFDGAIAYHGSSTRLYYPGAANGSYILACQFVLSGPANISYFELQVADASGFNLPVGVGRAALTGTIYKRVA